MKIKFPSIKKWKEDDRIFLFDTRRLGFFEISAKESEIFDLYQTLDEQDVIEQLKDVYEPQEIQDILNKLKQFEQPVELTSDFAEDIFPEHNIHVVLHVHWNPEWTLTAQHTQMRSVPLLDHILDILDSNPDVRYFTLDGQTMIVEDYLETRPERRQSVEEYVRQGRLLVGPWYIETNQFLVSGESIIRNLMLGHRLAETPGGVMPVGYVPDAAGQISQMPQILQGFGINGAMIYRGIPPGKTEYEWRAPDGSSVLLTHMPHFFDYGDPRGMSDLPRAFRMIQELQEDLIPRASTKNILLMCNTKGPLSVFLKTIERIGICLENGGKLIYSNPRKYIEDVKTAKPCIDTICGELRQFGGVSIAPGVSSTRMDVKQRNALVQTSLERYAEPLASFTWIFGAEYPNRYLQSAWNFLLKNQFSDTISGCCIDDVYDYVDYRFMRAQEIAKHITDWSLDALASGINTQGIDVKEVCLCVFNTLSWRRTDLIEVDIVLPQGKSMKDVGIFDSQGRAIAFQQIGKVWKGPKLHIQPLSAPNRVWCRQARIAFIAEDVPACGYKTYRLSFEASHTTPQDDTWIATPGYAENKCLKIEFQDSGALTITHKQTGSVYHNCYLFEDGGDAGDTYTFAPPLWDTVVTNEKSQAEIELVEVGPVYAKYKVSLRMHLPEGLEFSEVESDTEDIGIGLEIGIERSKECIPYNVTSYVTLTRASERVDIVTEIDNCVKDHRFRVLFPSGIQTHYYWADTPFDVVKRQIDFHPSFGLEEESVPIYPHSTFVDLNDGDKGLAILTSGLPEHEVKDDDFRTIALTLLRSVRWLSYILVNRTSGLGPMLEIPKAQCQGKHRFSYAIFPHLGDWESGRVYQQALQHNTPLVYAETDRHDGVLENELSIVTVEPEELVITAIKKSGNDDILIVRLYNISQNNVQGKLRFSEPFTKAFLTNMNEIPISPEILPESDNSISINARSAQIITLGVYFR